MTHPDRTALIRLRHLHLTYCSYLERLFEHLTDSSDSTTIASLISETLYELWHSSCVSCSPGAVNEWILRCAVKQAKRFTRQHAAGRQSGRTPLSPLSIDERAVIYLVYTGHTRVQVASIVRLSCNDVDTLLVRARARLREHQGCSDGPVVDQTISSGDRR